MELDELIQQGWRDHADKTAEVADRLTAGADLVSDGEGAAKYMQLVNHAVGDHLGERTRALALCEAPATAAGAPPPEPVIVHLAAARVLGGEPEAAEAAMLALGGDGAQRARVGLIVAQGHANAGAWEDATTVYEAQVAIGDGLAAGHAAERTFALVSNSIASEGLDLAARSAVADALMERAAHVAHAYWSRIGNWVNNERAD
jgi:hypothetical protein